MTIQELLSNQDLGKNLRNLLIQFAAFTKALADNGIAIEFPGSDTTENKIDYDAPVKDSYKKTYRPITATEIVEANKAMTEAIAGEKWMEGFIAMAKLMAVLGVIP